MPFAADAIAQGREILLAQLQPATPPYVSVIPQGTTLRAFFISATGEAFIDLSPEIVSGHPGGSYLELLTVQALVHAVTANTPSVQRVQILVGGQEVDTLAGHIDLRQPLRADSTVLRRR